MAMLAWPLRLNRPRRCISGIYLRGLKAFADEHPQSRRIVVSLDPFTRRMGDVECIYAPEFLALLWSKGL